jgi:hypothetical protein
VPPEHARLLGYLIGDGYVGGKTPIAFINSQESLREDAAAIAETLGCKIRRREEYGTGLEVVFSHRPGEKNGVLELARWAEIWGHLAPEKKVPAPFFAPDISEEVVCEAAQRGTGDSWIVRNWGFFDDLMREYDRTGTPERYRPWSKDLWDVTAVSRHTGLSLPMAGLASQLSTPAFQERLAPLEGAEQ